MRARRRRGLWSRLVQAWRMLWHPEPPPKPTRASRIVARFEVPLEIMRWQQARIPDHPARRGGSEARPPLTMAMKPLRRSPHDPF
jgi:hypothetical protein